MENQQAPISKYSSSRPQPQSQTVLAPPVSFSPSSVSSSAGFPSSTGFSGCSASSSPSSVCLEHLAVWPSLVSSSPSSASSSSSPLSVPLQRCSKLDWNTVYHDFNRFSVGMFSHALKHNKTGEDAWETKTQIVSQASSLLLLLLY